MEGATRGDGADADRIRAIPARHPRRWVGTIVVLALVGAFLKSVSTNANFQWGVVGHYFASRDILVALLVTLELTAVAMAVGIVLGVILAVMRLSPVPVISGTAWAYIWFFRGTPVLVQLLFWYNLASLYHHIVVGIPFTHVVF